MTPEDKSDARPTEGSTTDPMFPPIMGANGPAPVNVSAVQGPVSSTGRAKEGSTEKLLTGLLQNENDAYLYKVKSKDSAGEDALAFNVSPRPLPVAHKTQEEAPVIVDERRIVTTPPGALKAVKREAEPTVPVGPRRSDKWVAFAVALFVVGVAGIFVVMWRHGEETSQPVGTSPGASERTGDPQIPPPDLTIGNASPPSTGATQLDVTADPIIESQRIPHPPKVTPPRGTNATTTAASANAIALPPAKATGPLPPDYDELKKGINH